MTDATHNEIMQEAARLKDAPPRWQPVSRAERIMVPYADAPASYDPSLGETGEYITAMDDWLAAQIRITPAGACRLRLHFRPFYDELCELCQAQEREQARPLSPSEALSRLSTAAQTGVAVMTGLAVIALLVIAGAILDAIGGH